MVKALFDLVLRSVGFGRRKPATPLGRAVRRSNGILTIAALVWLGLHLFPQLVFAHSVTAQGVTLYSRDPLPPSATTRIAEAMNLVGNSELAIARRTERIFICNQPWLYAVLGPTSYRAFAFEMPLTGNIFIAQADLTQNVCRGRAPAHNTRSFSGVAAHEITHELIQHRLGFVKAWRLPGWIAEGYPEYVARESSFPAEEALRLLSAGQEDPAPSFRYAVHRQMVTHAIDVEGYSFDQLVARAGDARIIKAQMLAAIALRRR